MPVLVKECLKASVLSGGSVATFGNSGFEKNLLQMKDDFVDSLIQRLPLGIQYSSLRKLKSLSVEGWNNFK